MIELFSFNLTYAELGIFFLVALLIGMSKTGIIGTGMAAVPLLAIVFGGKLSSGVLLPMLCLADIFAVWYYHRHAIWEHMIRLFPWVAIGILLGTYIGDQINDNVFRIIMAVIILGSLGVMIWQERTEEKQIPRGLWFAILLGILGGFTTMVGNLAGPVMALYLLTMRFPKNQYIGTAAWFFMIVNWVKIPFHVFVWKTITLQSFLLDLTAIPVIAIGAFLGISVVKKIPEKNYRWFIIIMTGVAAILMIF